MIWEYFICYAIEVALLFVILQTLWQLLGHRVDNCFGLTVWTFGLRVELWTCFSEVKPHSHPGQRVMIVPLFGWAKFVKQNPLAGVGWIQQEANIRPKKWFRGFIIQAGWTHWFTLQRRPLVFLNITTGRSAADNFVT